MHLMETLRYRSVPAAAVSIGVTRRCPLHCRHCSTESLMDSEEFPAEMFVRFAGTFTRENRPELVLLSGGEALLRPDLVREIAGRARAAGARSHVLSGLYFAQKPRIPKAVRAAIDAVDHFAASLDRFHEEEVPRAAVFRVLHELLADGKDVSLQLTGEGPEDAYLADIVAAVRTEFGDRVPMLVIPVAPVGRARQWMAGAPQAAHPMVTADPCQLAAWPVVGFNGQVTACGNQDVMDGKVPLPAHLFLGHIGHDDWDTIKQRCLQSPMVRAIRTLGPQFVAERSGCGSGEGYCGTCFKLSKQEGLAQGVRELALLPSTVALEQAVERVLVDSGPQTFARHMGMAKYADLITLGEPAREPEDAACLG